MSNEKKYWKGIEELTNSQVAEDIRKNEFAEELPADAFLGNKQKLEESNTSRRDFLKYMGFSTAAATLASCETPITKSIPYVTAPEELVPGIANYYATSFFDGHDYASVLIKTREGRPIHVEPNKMATFNGSANTRIQASVLNLYDSTRLAAPQIGGEAAAWQDVDSAITKGLRSADAAGKQVVLLSSSMISPSAKKLVNEFGGQYGNFKHVTYDAFSYSAQLDAIEEATGKRLLPTYKMENARMIVGFNADFLGDYMGQSMAPAYSKRRIPGENMSRHVQFESNMTNTGGSADQRYKIKASEIGPALTLLYNELSGGNQLSGGKTKLEREIKAVAKDLKTAGENAVVLTGSNDKDIAALTIAINDLLGNRGTVIDYNRRSYLRQGNDQALEQLISDMNAGRVGAILIHNLNPVYHLAGNQELAKGLANVDTSVYFSDKSDETAKLVKYVCAENYYLESWNDFMPADGIYSIQQPTIRPLFNTRQFEECLMSWMGKSGSYYEYVRSNWEGMGREWQASVHDGVYPVSSETEDKRRSDDFATGPEGRIGREKLPDEGAAEGQVEEENGGGFFANLFGGGDDDDAARATRNVDLNAAARRLNQQAKDNYELVFYQKAGMGVGKLANNPWLLEFPDPITRVSWDNYLTISAVDALELGVTNWNISNGALNGSYVNLTANGQTIENVPVFIQPGQTPKTVGLAVGFGRNGAGKAADGVGVNAFRLMNKAHHTDVQIDPIEDSEHEFACIQLAHTMMGRKIVNETNLQTFLNEPASNEKGSGWNQDIVFETHKGPLGPEATNLWDDFEYEIGHLWNMSIDLNLCNGCGSCVIACHTENNVPVVGKEEMRRHRDMHWLRIDRYYSSDMTEEAAEEQDLSGIEKFAEMEVAGQSPDVYFQPVMCQHCNHAPCETVCPVIATSHNSEGVNQMTYNRCIGTRYCANNCPYKVRRFNWFQYYNGSQEKFDVNYAMNEDLGRMVLNPDVTVRSRGVMEKCSFCIQRTQLGKLEAKKEERQLRDGEVQTACMSACDTGAIVFGDVNDKQSRVYELKQNKRMYHLLAEIGTQPSVFYQTKVRNRS